MKQRKYYCDLETLEIEEIPPVNYTEIVTDPAQWERGKLYLPRNRIVFYATTNEEARQKMDLFLEGWEYKTPPTGSLTIKLWIGVRK
jgi:hypothetical protein